MGWPYVFWPGDSHISQNNHYMCLGNWNTFCKWTGVDVRARKLLTTVNFGTARSRLKKSKRVISFVMVRTWQQHWKHQFAAWWNFCGALQITHNIMITLSHIIYIPVPWCLLQVSPSRAHQLHQRTANRQAKPHYALTVMRLEELSVFTQYLFHSEFRMCLSSSDLK